MNASRVRCELRRRERRPDHLRGRGPNIRENSTETTEICSYQVAHLHTSTEFLTEPPRATQAIVEAPVVYAVHIVAPPSLPYAINQVQLTAHNYIM